MIHVSPERKYIAISIKHSLPARGVIMNAPLVLWGHRTEDNASRRSFGGYTTDPSKCELYTLEEWRTQGGYEGFIDSTPVSMNLSLFRNYKKRDTVLVLYEDYMNYYRLIMNGRN